MPVRSVRKAALPLATGQTTQYSSELDDGNYEKGLAKRYEILTTSAYSGTTNVDLTHLSSAAIGFNAGGPHKITSGTVNLTTVFVTGDVLVVSGATNPENNGTFNVTLAEVGALTLAESTLVTEAEGATVTIAKREAHSNNCVLDLNTGLMWSRYVSDKMGTAGNGKMPWTGQLYDIFAYCAAANTASLAGYTDWRVCNLAELVSILNLENSVSIPDSTAWPSFPSGEIWTSSTAKGDTDYAFQLREVGQAGSLGIVAKTANDYCLLVRGG